MTEQKTRTLAEVDPAELMDDDDKIFFDEDEEQPTEEEAREKLLEDTPALQDIVDNEDPAESAVVQEPEKPAEDTTTAEPIAAQADEPAVVPEPVEPEELELPDDQFLTQLNNLAAKNLEQQQRLAQLQAQQQPVPAGVPVAQPPVPEQAAPTPPPAPPAGYQEPAPPAISQDVYDAAMQSKDAFSRVVQAYSDQARQAAVQQAMQQTQQTLPQIVDQLVLQRWQQQQAFNVFFQTHKDLARIPEFVQLKANELHNAHPDWDLRTLMTELASAARRDLQAVQRQQQAAQPKPVPATETPASAAHARPASTVSPLERDMTQIIIPTGM